MKSGIQWPELMSWIGDSSRILIKKLSRNDCAWADSPENGHQNGFYVPGEIRNSGFFPHLENSNADKPHIFETIALTIWPATGEVRPSRLVHYSNKGQEMHVTRVPKDQFNKLTPASLLVCGLLKTPRDNIRYWIATIDSASQEAELIESMFEIGVGFHYGLFLPADIVRATIDDTQQLIDELRTAMRAGSMDTYIANVSRLPAPEIFAQRAQAAYMSKYGRDNLNPFSLQCPGDAIMEISRDIEYSLFKQAERRHRAADVVNILTKDGADIVEATVNGFSALYATFLSASQVRKNRAGRSFEHHIGRLLQDGGMPYQEQVVSGSRRPDFVIPDLARLNLPNRNHREALILSAKTTLRERWKQVTLEQVGCDFYLATVDDRISSEAIDDMKNQDIHLLVPESLKKSKETCYGSKDNVMTFRDFFQEELAPRKALFWV